MKHLYRYICFFLLFAFSGVLPAREDEGPAARFTFNGRDCSDEISGREGRLTGAAYTEDRFGNRDHAIFLSGNQFSYFNAGTYKALKPEAGTISLWVKIEDKLWAGQGHKLNPILLTKNSAEDDFYESFSLYYTLESGKIVAAFMKDSTRETCLYSMREFKRNEWGHLVIAYDDDNCLLYINGELQSRLPKNFRTRFQENDSVMLGNSANQKNRRYMIGAVDDLEFYHRILSEEEIKALYHAPNPRKKKIIFYWMLGGACCLLLILLLYLFIRSRVRKGIEREKQKIELRYKLLETELRVNRALMNPHFVFNALNSLQSLIMSKEYLSANEYLVKFSALMRVLLESNISGLVSLDVEISLIEKYLEIECLRFDKDITCVLKTDPALVTSSVRIPVMLLQPFIENAIWHGLIKKEGEKILEISFARAGDRYVECRIEDNGIGRKKAGGTHPANKALATLFVIQRLELLNEIHRLNCYIEITDKPDNAGTRVKILLPIL
jgi:hypothetical protein